MLNLKAADPRKERYGNFKEGTAEFPLIFTKIYGNNPVVWLDPPLNTNETGYTKKEDIQGTRPVKQLHRASKTMLDVYGSLGGSSPRVTSRYLQGLRDADRANLPLVAAEIYEGPSVKLPLPSFDVSQFNTSPGMVSRIYAGKSDAAAKAEARPLGAKIGQWLKSGEFK